jgi:hypothetical protein
MSEAGFSFRSVQDVNEKMPRNIYSIFFIVAVFEIHFQQVSILK